MLQGQTLCLARHRPQDLGAAFLSLPFMLNGHPRISPWCPGIVLPAICVPSIDLPMPPLEATSIPPGH